ncbi:MAG: TonB family protein [Acidobacteria bacterium]|nr:TonB family protein [Acidobacteriota bacterium]
MAHVSEFRFLVDWEEESIRSRHRESLLTAAVLHLGLLVLVLISPAVLAQPHPVELVDLTQQGLTLLVLPPDLQPKPEPKPELTPEERERMARRKSLTVNPRDLAVILPPEPLPGPRTENPSAGGQPEAAPRGEGTRREPEPVPPAKEWAQLENLPRPAPRGESPLELPQASPGRAIEESLRRSQGTPGGGGEGGPIQPNFNTPFPTILSDTRGVDFGPYLIRLLREVRRNWYAVIPESARWGEQGRVVIVFSIQKDGSVPLGQPTVVRSSGRSHLDRPAFASIRASQPFPPLPEEFTGENIVLQFTFLYNLPLDYTGP